MASDMLKRYVAVKERYPNALLLARNGNQYEAHFDDAVIVAMALGIEPQKHECGTVVSFCVGALNEYMPRLLKVSRRVAICEEMLDRVAYE